MKSITLLAGSHISPFVAKQLQRDWCCYSGEPCDVSVLKMRPCSLYYWQTKLTRNFITDKLRTTDVIVVAPGSDVFCSEGVVNRATVQQVAKAYESLRSMLVATCRTAQIICVQLPPVTKRPNFGDPYTVDRYSNLRTILECVQRCNSRISSWAVPMHRLWSEDSYLHANQCSPSELMFEGNGVALSTLGHMVFSEAVGNDFVLCDGDGYNSNTAEVNKEVPLRQAVVRPMGNKPMQTGNSSVLSGSDSSSREHMPSGSNALTSCRFTSQSFLQDVRDASTVGQKTQQSLPASTMMEETDNAISCTSTRRASTSRADAVASYLKTLRRESEGKGKIQTGASKNNHDTEASKTQPASGDKVPNRQAAGKNTAKKMPMKSTVMWPKEIGMNGYTSTALKPAVHKTSKRHVTVIKPDPTVNVSTAKQVKKKVQDIRDKTTSSKSCEKSDKQKSSGASSLGETPRSEELTETKKCRSYVQEQNTKLPVIQKASTEQSESKKTSTPTVIEKTTELCEVTEKTAEPAMSDGESRPSENMQSTTKPKTGKPDDEMHDVQDGKKTDSNDSAFIDELENYDEKAADCNNKLDMEIETDATSEPVKEHVSTVNQAQDEKMCDVTLTDDTTHDANGRKIETEQTNTSSTPTRVTGTGASIQTDAGGKGEDVQANQSRKRMYCTMIHRRQQRKTIRQSIRKRTRAGRGKLCYAVAESRKQVVQYHQHSSRSSISKTVNKSSTSSTSSCSQVEPPRSSNILMTNQPPPLQDTKLSLFGASSSDNAACTLENKNLKISDIRQIADVLDGLAPVTTAVSTNMRNTADELSLADLHTTLTAASCVLRAAEDIRAICNKK